MKIQSIAIRGFKRFAHLDISDIPASAKLVVIAGPNGFGKSSLFDALQLWASQTSGRGWLEDRDYYDRPTLPSELQPIGSVDIRPVSAQIPRAVTVSFHNGNPPAITLAAKKSLYFRSAYRNDPDLTIGGLSKMGPSVDEVRFRRMIETDTAVTNNYQRLASDALDDIFERADASTSIGVFREQVIGDLRASIQRLFPNLQLDSLGSPLRDPTFRFTKGASKGFVYKNLSGGEKASFDLLLGLIVKRREYDDTVFCIDEPETHLNPRIHGLLLNELVQLIPNHSQLWITTHAIGMLRAARDMWKSDRDSVVFLDFDGCDFDAPVTLTPVTPTRTFWSAALRVALDDLADLVAPQEVVICEGSAGVGRNADHDARCYNTIFQNEFPETLFVSGGNSHDVVSDRLGFADSLPTIVKGTTVIRLTDRDDHTDQDIQDLASKGVAVLQRRNLEAYPYDDEVLKALCIQAGQPELSETLIATKIQALADSAKRGNPPDDLKKAAPAIHQGAKRLLAPDLLGPLGNDHRAFERDFLAKLVQIGMQTYSDLKRDVFASS